MYNIKTLNKISEKGLKYFSDSKYTVSDSVENPDAIILRSFSMHDMELPESLLAVGRAGAGVNNIPIDKCAEKGIVVFNTPGANANAVKELTVLGLLIASRNVCDGVEWAKTLKDDPDAAKKIEKGKGQFAGPEIMGKKLAVIGLGAIGVMVANAAYNLGMDVLGYDPYISVKAALGLSRHVELVQDLKTLLSDADYVSIHVPLLPDTKGMISEELVSYMKDGVRILNFARGPLVDFEAVKKALQSGKAAAYVTDFPDTDTLSLPNTVCIPHLGASTNESEENCAEMAAKEIIDFLENGNITNSVNYPNCELAREDGVRITVAHKNIPNMLSRFSGLLADNGVNIENLVNKSKKEFAYTILDIGADTPEKTIDEVVKEIKKINDVLAVRVIR